MPTSTISMRSTLPAPWAEAPPTTAPRNSNASGPRMKPLRLRRGAGGTSRRQSAVRLDRFPDLLFGEIEEACEHQQEHHHLQPDALARFHMRLRRPGQERGDVARHLIDRRLGAVVVGHAIV